MPLRPEGRYEVKSFAVVLMIIGIYAMIYGGVSYSRQVGFLDAGPFVAAVTEQRQLPWSPFVGGIALISGIVLLTIAKKRYTSVQMHERNPR